MYLRDLNLHSSTKKTSETASNKTSQKSPAAPKPPPATKLGVQTLLLCAKT